MNAQKQSEKVLHVCEEWRTNTRKREKGTSLGKWHGLHGVEENAVSCSGKTGKLLGQVAINFY